MADYAVGDIQGCYRELSALLKKVDFNPSRDHLYCVGDIVARGPRSLKCLRTLESLQGSVSISLGNHDLHLLACHHLNKKPNPKDKLAPVFAAKDKNQLMAFLQHQPLAIWLDNYQTLICHAGLSPEWSLKKGLKRAAKAQKCYQGKDAAHYFSIMYANTPNQWQYATNKDQRFIYTINSFTRMRMVNQSGALNFAYKGKPSGNKQLIPWFMHQKRQQDDFSIVFGHWAALEGQTHCKKIHALDTGCVWGNNMTLMELSHKKRRLHSIKSKA